MKKCILILLTITIAVFAPVTASASAEAAPCYALIGDNATFYMRSDTDFKPLFVLPQGYFVRLTGEENGDYFAANYLDLNGYVLASGVEKVDYTPRYKYNETNSLTIVGDGHAVNLRSAPDHTTKNVLTEIPDETVAYFYGTQAGTSQIPAIGEQWYYVRSGSGSETVRGYVYSLYADAKPVMANVIEREPAAPTEPAVEETEQPSDYTMRDEIIIVVSLCIPAIVVMYLLFCAPRARR